MTSNYEKGQKAEAIAKSYLQQRFICEFEPKALQVGITSDGKPAMHNFDLVSPDCKIVAEVKAHTMTETGNVPSGKIDNAYNACAMLEKVSAEKKFLLLTDPDFYLKFKKYSNGKIDSKIVIQLIPIEDNKEFKKSKSGRLVETPKMPPDMTFDVFWSELKTFLSSKRNIRNWTVLKGYVGENFEAVYDFGKIIVYAESASAYQQTVQRQDFKLIFDNWQKYLDGTVSRLELSQSSWVTKYAISIIHEYLCG